MMMLWIVAAQAQEIPFERYELANGLQVILHEDHSLPQIVVDTWYQVGSKDESPGRSGFAHLFEHLMFMGTNRVPNGEFDQRMEAAGGWNNAWTMEDATNYYDVGPSNLLPLFLWMEADRMVDLGNAMTQDKLDKQRDIVKNERRQSYEDEPYGVAWLEIPRLLYPLAHPYGHTVIGSHDDLTAATLQDVKDFFATWYVPNNASLVIAGDFKPDEAKELVARYYSGIPARALPERKAPEQLRAPQMPRIDVQDQVDYPQVNLLWHTPAAYAAGDAEMQLIASLLGDGESSRLYRALVLEGLAQDVQVYEMPTQYGSSLIISATASEKVKLEQIDAVIAEELERLRTEPATEAEMERLKNQFEYGFLTTLESLQERAVKLNEYDAYTGSPDYLAKDLARYRGVTAEGLRAAAAEWLASDKAGRIVVQPEVKAEVTP